MVCMFDILQTRGKYVDLLKMHFGMIYEFCMETIGCDPSFWSSLLFGDFQNKLFYYKVVLQYNWNLLFYFSIRMNFK